MDCSPIAENFLSKFDIKGKAVFARILWQNTTDRLFHVKVFSEEQSWSGEFSSEMCKIFGENFDENDEQYANNVKEALKRKSNLYTYDFIVEDGTNIAKFIWKRKFADSTATVVHGLISLKKDEFAGTQNEIIDFLLHENKSLSLTIEGYKQTTERLKSDLDNWKNEFEKFVDIKNSLETTLYGKFIQLLNCKKRRIQELEHHLNES